MEKSHVEVLDPTNNWFKSIELEDRVILIGPKAPDSIELPQMNALGDRGRLMIRPPIATHPRYVLLNLSEKTIKYQPYPQLEPLQDEVNLHYNQSIVLADRGAVVFEPYKLIYYAGERAGRNFRMEVKLPDHRLSADPRKPLQGVVHITCPNGDSLQPVLEIQGIESHVESAPRRSNTYDGLQVPFALFHPQKSFPPYGTRHISFWVATPTDDPTDYATQTHKILIEPYLAHELKLQLKQRANLFGRSWAALKKRLWRSQPDQPSNQSTLE